ncbi:MAG: CRISPR-associated endoribonuclease Cas6 [Planctomycetota bacterium]
MLPLSSLCDKVVVKMLSPITIYSTLTKRDGSKKTYYYNPFENEFGQLIRDSGVKKIID